MGPKTLSCNFENSLAQATYDKMLKEIPKVGPLASFLR